jgi:hypothetical protein
MRRKETIVSESMNYLFGITLLLLGLSPLAVPVGITGFGAVADRWPTYKRFWPTTRRQGCAVGATV